MAAAAPSSRRWLFGPAPDLLLGCGVLYAAVLLAFSIGGSELRQRQADFLLPLLFITLGAPHYGATLLRVYEERSERRRYALFTLWITAALVALFFAGLVYPLVAAWLLTIYLTWSPWHYTGQNYGIAVMFLRRRGVDLTPGVKRWVYTSFVLSFLLTVLIFHGPIDSSPAPEFYSGGSGNFHSLGLPPALMEIVFPLAFVAYAVATLGAVALLLRRASLRDLVPALMLVLTQALWFTIPMIVRYWRLSTGIEPFRWELRPFYFFWIALGHATQYLWITTYYARESRGWRGYGRYVFKALAAGTAVWTLPMILFGPRFAGALPNAQEVAVLVAAVVNLHHFILDGAIWKLRNLSIARILIRSDAAAAESGDAPQARAPWGRRLVWLVASLGFALTAFKYLVGDVLYPSALRRNDFDSARTWIDAYAWVSDVSPEARRQLTESEEQQRQLRRQRERRLQHQLGLLPNVGLYLRRAQRYEQGGDWEAALGEYRSALRVDPENVDVLRAEARIWQRQGRPEQARQALERAAALQPWNDQVRRELAQLGRGEAAASP